MATEQNTRLIKQFGEDLKHYIQDELEANQTYTILSQRAAALKMHTTANRLKIMAKDEYRHHSSLIGMTNRIDKL